jgi:Tol biopolymer transport system component
MPKRKRGLAVQLLVVNAIVLLAACSARKQPSEEYLSKIFPESQARLSDKIAFVMRYGKLVVVSAQRIDTVDIARVSHVAWSPDGRALLLSISDEGSSPYSRLLVLSGEDWSSHQVVQPNLYASGGVDWSPDGQRILYSGGRPGTFSADGGIVGVYIANSDGTQPVLVADCHCLDCCLSPVWSPNGDRIAFWGPNGVEVVELDDLSHRDLVYPRTNVPVLPTRKVSWFADSRRLLISDGLQLKVVSLDDRIGSTLFEVTSAGMIGYVQGIALPDGQHIAYKASYYNGVTRQMDHEEIMLANLNDMVWRDVTPGRGLILGPAAPDADNALWAANFVSFAWWQAR